jgi:hypothetical protein
MSKKKDFFRDIPAEILAEKACFLPRIGAWVSKNCSLSVDVQPHSRLNRCQSCKVAVKNIQRWKSQIMINTSSTYTNIRENFYEKQKIAIDDGLLQKLLVNNQSAIDYFVKYASPDKNYALKVENNVFYFNVCMHIEDLACNIDMRKRKKADHISVSNQKNKRLRSHEKTFIEEEGVENLGTNPTMSSNSMSEFFCANSVCAVKMFRC